MTGGGGISEAGSFIAARLRGRQGPLRLLASFENHAYLHLEDPALTLILSRAPGPAGPLDVKPPVWAEWETLLSHAPARLRPDGRLHLGSLTLDLSPGAMRLRDTALTVDSLPAPDPLLRGAAGIAHASDLLASVLSAPAAPRVAGIALDPLALGLVQDDPVALRQGAERLVGLGRGLTPAGDDFLAGLLIAMAAAGSSDDSRKAILDAATGATTTLSLAFLAAAAAGHVTADWQALLRLPADASKADRAHHLARVMAPGHSSGADTLAGFLWAASRLQPAP